MTKFEMFKLCLENYEKIKDKGTIWFHKDGEIAAILKPYGRNYSCFIISGKMVYNFIFNPGGNEFVHAIIRKNNSYINISGINSMNSFTYIHNLSYMYLVTSCGNVKENLSFWEELFETY